MIVLLKLILTYFIRSGGYAHSDRYTNTDNGWVDGGREDQRNKLLCPQYIKMQAGMQQKSAEWRLIEVERRFWGDD